MFESIIHKANGDVHTINGTCLATSCVATLASTRALAAAVSARRKVSSSTALSALCRAAIFAALASTLALAAARSARRKASSFCEFASLVAVRKATLSVSAVVAKVADEQIGEGRAVRLPIHCAGAMYGTAASVVRVLFRQTRMPRLLPCMRPRRPAVKCHLFRELHHRSP